MRSAARGPVLRLCRRRLVKCPTSVIIRIVLSCFVFTSFSDIHNATRLRFSRTSGSHTNNFTRTLSGAEESNRADEFDVHPDNIDDVFEPASKDSDTDGDHDMTPDDLTHTVSVHPSSSASSSSAAAVPVDVVEWTPPAARVLPDVPYPEHNVLFLVPGGGTIRFYARDRQWEAQCPNTKVHGCCRITRTCNGPKGRKKMSNPGQGRTFAFLCAWCAEHNQSDRVLHKTSEPSLASRSKWREYILDQPEGSAAWQMLGAEAILQDGEIHYNGEIEQTS